MINAAKRQQALKTEESFGQPVALVAGAAGFIASFLCEELLKLNCRVVGIDNLVTGSKNNLEDILNHRSFEFINEDINSDKFSWTGKVDYVFHLAGVEEYAEGKNVSLNNLLVKASGTSKLLEVAKKYEAKFELVTAHEAQMGAEALLTEYYRKFHLNARIIRIADVYGPRQNLNSSTPLANLFRQALLNKTLKIPGDGLKILRPTYISDLITGLLRAIFGQNTDGKIYHLVSSEEISLIGFAHELQKQLGENAKIVFVKEEDLSGGSLAKGANTPKGLGWSTKVGMAEGIQKTLAYFSTRRELIKEIYPIPEVNILQKRVVKIELNLSQFFPKGNFFRSALLALLILILVFSLPALSLFISIKTNENNFRILGTQIKSQNLLQAQATLAEIKKNFTNMQNKLTFYGWVFNLLGKEDSFSETSKLISAGVLGVDGASHLLVSAKNFNDAGQIIFSPEETSKGLGIKLGLAKEELILAENKLSLVQTELSNVDFSKVLFLKLPTEKVQEQITRFNNFRILVSRLRETSNVFPQIFGLSGKKTYLLLFTNNMELRPVGGFIGSYGLVSFEKGKLTELKIDDVYNADGQLTGHVEPPGPIRKILGQPHWYLRDSNWSPDLGVSAERAEWFLEKETGKRVDGTMVMDLNVVRGLLSVLGPMNLADYQETITADNLFTKATSYSQENFFPGSTQKKDFLSALSGKIIDQLLTRQNKSYLGLLILVEEELREKHLGFYLHDEATENLVARFDFGGRISGDVCGIQKNCLSDYLMVVDANLGVNKANYYIKKNVQHKINISEDLKISETVDITYENTDLGKTKLGGVYRNYLRVYLPPATQLTSLQVDKKDAPFIITKGDKKEVEGVINIEQTEELGKTAYGFLVEVPPANKKVISLYYQLPNLGEGEAEGLYKLVWQKQIGAQNDEYFLSFSHPGSWEVVQSPTEAKTTPGKIEYGQSLDADKILTLRFKKHAG
ncbi:DUF4012 domain-containing protein [Candidatus Gottesmanbacteria bacterium]|nr:DUF4012 domain-containing protein [Candidatus Gottesmanbacteria bacterium]